ncbi:unnamed protein product [Rotaria sordida]|uniref:OTU domain-containing protein n=1 Tax=Rotaria sordida TaxID=392033 RepID=A0A814ZEZ2_9BILA|nr:unnamed protein product [Rotaria sordida]CAF3944986.1 unnamed protein product [Rotaria sordida]
MAQTNSTSSVVNSTDSTDRSTKPSDTLRPHYYTTFQNSCCDPKSNSSTETQAKDILPIPQKCKDEVKSLLEFLHQGLIVTLTDIATYTSVIPYTFLEKNDIFDTQRYLIDRGMFRTMNDAHIINWIPSFRMLCPIRTSGNGNCLLHAVLIAMVGIHDFDLYLRDRLVQFMDENKDILKNHWKKERLKSDKNYGIRSEDSKLDEEWDELCNLVRYENSADGQTASHLEFLEAVHIFSISNMLRRPIIILSEDVIRNKQGEAISVNDLFGIYLPILSIPQECITEPIVLAYDRSHFCALQTSNLDVEKTLDNRLPLYLSIDQASKNISLPIRFLGDDENIEQSNNLLHDYLQIQKIEYTFDQNTPPLSILSAALGSKHLQMKDDFFCIYRKYLNYFFEVQKPKAMEEERERERQRQLDDYINRYVHYDTKGQSIIKQDSLPSSSYTPMSARSNTTYNDIHLRNQNNDYYDQRYSYDGTYTNEPYIPSNGTIHIKNLSNQPQPSERTSNYPKVAQTDRDVDYTKGQQQRVIEIPVQHTTPRASSNDSTLFISEDRRDPVVECVLCNRSFRYFNSTYICPSCESTLHRPTSYNDVLDPPYIRPRSTNIHSTGHDTRYVSSLSPVPKARVRHIIDCPRCKNPNLNYRSSDSTFFCSACNYPIRSAYLHY